MELMVELVEHIVQIAGSLEYMAKRVWLLVEGLTEKEERKMKADVEMQTEKQEVVGDKEEEMEQMDTEWELEEKEDGDVEEGEEQDREEKK